jgi:hypothetical protein
MTGLEDLAIHVIHNATAGKIWGDLEVPVIHATRIPETRGTAEKHMWKNG